MQLEDGGVGLMEEAAGLGYYFDYFSSASTLDHHSPSLSF